MRDRRLEALEIRGLLDADQRNILRHPESPVEQELGGGGVLCRAVDENRGGRGPSKQ